MPEVNFNLLNPGAELYSGPQVTLDPVKAYETAQAKQQSNMLAQLYAKHYDPQTGGVNYNSLIGEAAQNRLTAEKIPEIMGDAQKQSQSMAEIAQKRALQQQEEATAAAKRDEIRREKIKEMATESYGRFRGVKDEKSLLAWHLANPELEGTNKAERTAKLQQDLKDKGYEAVRAEIEGSLQAITGIKPETYAPTEIEKLLSLRSKYALGTPERDALEAKIKLETTRAPAASTTLVMPPTELAEKKAWGEQLVKDYSEGIKPAADQARKNLATVDVLQNLLDKGLQTGWSTQLEGQVRNALTKMGVEGAKDLAGDIQTFQAFVRQNVLNEQMKQKGVQTEGDAQRIQETFANLSNTPDANKFLVAVRRVQLNRDIAQQKFWTDWKSKHGTFDGAEEAWINGEGSTSIFDSPSLKKYTETKPVTSPSDTSKQMPTGAKLTAYAKQHFNGDEAKAKKYLTSQGYR